jgi:hypothetical protein
VVAIFSSPVEGSTNILYAGHEDYFLAAKRGVDLSTPTRAEVKERLEV